MLDKVIMGSRVATEGWVSEANIGIKGGSIVTISDPTISLEAKEIIDGKGKIVIPGVIDAHTHVNTFNVWDVDVNRFKDIAITAAYGGITTLLIHLWGPEGMSMPETINKMIEEGEKCSPIDFSFHCGVRPRDDHIRGIPDAIRIGVSSFKFLMAYRKSGFTGRTVDDYHMMRGMELIAAHGGISLVHAENGLIIDYFEEKYTREGKVSLEYFLPSRPNAVETEAIHRAAVIANLTQCPLYIVHMSAKEGLEEVIQERLRGNIIHAETCPQYLCFTNKELVEGGSRFKVAPPLRTEADREALWKGIQNGFIETLGSDAGEYTLNQRKERDGEDIFKSLFGMPGAETMVSLIYSEGVAKGRISLTQLVRLVSENPAKIFGLYPRKGTIRVGSDADLVLIDPNIRWTIKANDLHSKSDYSCYEGMQLIGKPVLSLVRGEVLVKDGNLEQSPGYGRFIPRLKN